MSTAMVIQPVVTPMSLIQQAIEKGATIDVVERMVALQRDIREDEVRIAFDGALNRCQAQLKRVAADMQNPQTHSKYASYAALDRVVRPIYTAEGFSVSFGEHDNSTAQVLVLLAHLSREGHTRTYRKTVVVDTKGPKGNEVMTKVHAAGAAGSYAKRYLLKDIFNLAIGEDDQDGNDLGADPQRMEGEEIERYEALIAEARTMEDLRRVYAKGYNAAKEIGDKGAMKTIIAAYDKQKGALL